MPCYVLRGDPHLVLRVVSFNADSTRSVQKRALTDEKQTSGVTEGSVGNSEVEKESKKKKKKTDLSATEGSIGNSEIEKDSKKKKKKEKRSKSS